MVIIGDVHGKLTYYKNIIDKCDRSIQLGDFGFKREHDWHIKNIDGTKHKLLFGNHDYYPYLYKIHSLGDYAIVDDYIMCIRGAHSIDKWHRLEGRDWFREEELEYAKWFEIIDKIKEVKPAVIISHDCPQIIREMQFNIYDKSRTSDGLQACFIEHQPELWLFGHHHMTIDVRVKGTRFICLNELETYKLPE